MAFGNSQAYTVKYVPTNIEPQLAGLDSNLSPHNSGGSFSFKYGIELVKQNVVELLTTKRGDRVMLPTFGTNIHKALFEPLDEYLKADIEKEILRTISEFEPRVDVLSLEVLEYDEVTAFTYEMYDGRSQGGMVEHKLQVELVVALKNDITASASIVLAY